MKGTKAKLILVSMILLGFVIGFLVAGQLTRREMNEMMRWGTEEGFRDLMIETIEPTPEQEISVNPIIDKYAKLNGELYEKWKMEHGLLMRALTLELKEVLTPEQMEKWKAQGEHKNKN